MRKILLPLAMAGTLALGGCAAYGGNGGLLGGILGNDRYDDDRYGYDGGDDFERAAVRACGREASRYGRIRIDDVDRRSRDLVRVRGRIDVRNRDRDEFYCVFRSDGRIVEFRRT